MIGPDQWCTKGNAPLTDFDQLQECVIGFEWDLIVTH